MHSVKHMNLPERNVIYLYDGSFEGFLCCVHESVYAKEMPFDIVPEGNAPLSLIPERFINTDEDMALKVQRSIPEKISREVLSLIQTVFLSCMKNKEMHILRFLLIAYKKGPSIIYMAGDELVAPLLKAAKHVGREAHLLKGFVRFSDYGGSLAAVITPKNFILPFIANHFTVRFEDENFMIFDKTHKAALVWKDRKQQIITVENVEFPNVLPEEKRYQELWKQFYNTIAIEARINPRCRMTHMPKRYWENMTEVRDLL